MRLKAQTGFRARKFQLLLVLLSHLTDEEYSGPPTVAPPVRKQLMFEVPKVHWDRRAYDELR